MINKLKKKKKKTKQEDIFKIIQNEFKKKKFEKKSLFDKRIC